MDKALLARVEKQAWIHRYPRGWPFLLFVLTGMVTAIAVIAIERAETERQQLELDRNFTEIAAGLQRRAAENVALLNAAAALSAARPGMTAAEFAEIAAVVHGRGDRHGSLGIGWARWLEAGGVADFEAALRRSQTPAAVPVPQPASAQRPAKPAFTVRPRPDAGQRYALPVLYMEPETPGNTSAIGFDMYSESVRRQAIEAAIRLRRPVASGRVQLVQDVDKPATAGFLMFMPVYQAENGRRILAGFVISPFRVEEFVDSAAELMRNRQFEVAIYDERLQPEELLAWRQRPGENGPSTSRPIVVADRTWVLRVSMKKPAVLSTLSKVTLFFGAVLALLVMLIARLITKRAAEDRIVLEALQNESAIRNSLTRELNHRVKNTLANVLSIVALTRRRSSGIDDFAESLIGRVRALSATHDLLSQSDWTNAPVKEVVRSELAPYMAEHESHVEMSGPDISLAPNDALSLGLAIHELATNAAKYGALSSLEGRVFVTWRLISPGVAEVHWREAGGPPVQAPSRRGFGRDLLEKIVAHELKSEVELQFHVAGVECRLHVPVRRLGDFALRRRERR